MLKYIPTIITDDQNAQIIEMPDEVKIKNTVFGLNSDSAGGPDEYTAKKKSQACWNIIAKAMTKMVKSFFCVHEAPKVNNL